MKKLKFQTKKQKNLNFYKELSLSMSNYIYIQIHNLIKISLYA